MKKLTDENYFLPVVFALEAGSILDAGRTRPTVIRGVCQTTNLKGEYVVKFKGARDMSLISSFKEILAAFIAMELDFCIPAPALINISPEFLTSMEHRHGNFDAASQSLGFNFGNKLESGFQQPLYGQQVPEKLIQAYSDLLAFDIFIGNPDRRVDKANFLTDGRKLLIFDHELAFSFNEAFIRNPRPWLIPQIDMNWINNNFCFQVLRGMNINFSGFTERLVVLDDNFWQKASDAIPIEWNNGLLDSVRQYLNLIITNKDQFAVELNRILL